jgi:hypothetical protein
MVTVQEAAITTLQDGVRAEYALWRYAGDITLFDPNGIGVGFLPVGPGWEEVTEASGGAGASFAHDGTGGTITFTVLGYRRDEWPDDQPVALVGRWWDGLAYSAWRTVGWGYTTGAGRTRRGADGIVRFDVSASIVGRWDQLPVPGIAFGRANLATGATPGYSAPALVNPEELVPQEYAYQDDTGPEKAIDGNVDTVAAAETLATTQRLEYGSFDHPRIASFFGPHDRGVAVGGIARFIQLAYTHNGTPWGVTWTSIPPMYNAVAGEGKPALREDDKIATQVATYPDGRKAFRVRNKQSSDPKRDTWIQWRVLSSRVNVPMRVSLELKASSTSGIGKRLQLGVTTSASVGAQGFSTVVELGVDWQIFVFDWDSSTDYGGATMSIKTTPGELVAGDFYYDLSNFRVLYGWNHDEWSKRNGYKSLYLGLDDGLGHEKWQRISWELAPGGNWSIAPESTVVIADDAATLKANHAIGRSTVFQLKNAYKWWHFEPDVGRMKLALMNQPPDPNNIDALPAGAIVIEDINFATNGLSWLPTQAMVRKNPWGTGGFVADDYPGVGLGEQIGAGWWTYDLGAFTPPVLQEPAAVGDTVLWVSGTRPFQGTGTVRIQAEDLAYTAKEEGALVLASPVATAHAAGLPVVPLTDGKVGPGSSPQIAKTWDYLELRRREGVPPLRDGVIFGSKLANPGDPSAGGARWERHPDWFPIHRFRDNQAAVIAVHAPGNPTNSGVWVWADQLRHVGIAVDVMHPDDLGRPQHPMLNELIVSEWVPESGAGGAYDSPDSGDLAGMIGHLLVKYAGLAAAKYLPAIPAIPLGTLTVTPTTVAQAVSSVAQRQLARLWVDGLGFAHLTAAPNSLLFDAQDVTWEWTEQNCWGPVPDGDREAAHNVAQVVIYAREPGTLRHHTIAYPSVRLPLGSVLELKDVVVSSRRQGEDFAAAAFRDANARRSLTIQAGACPWIAPFQRHLVNLPSLDPSGEWTGVNMYVAGYTMKFAAIAGGGVVCRTAITLREMAL